MIITNKNNIAGTFSKSFKYYKNEAVIQKKIAFNLCKKIVSVAGSYYDNILEIGYGTGFLTEEILKNINTNQIFLNDISETAENEISFVTEKYQNTKFRIITGDAETINFPENLSAVFSASCYQWFNNFPRFAEKISSKIKKNGIFAFSTFGKQNYREVRASGGKSLNYFSLSEITEILSEKFVILHNEEYSEILEFQNVRDVMAHIKRTGVGGLGGKQFSFKELRVFSDKYENLFRNNNGRYSLTYHPQIFICKKK